MRMKLEDLPDRVSKYPERANFAISQETAKKIKFLKDNGKDVPEILRTILESGLSGIHIPASEKKIS